jgi:hypothetical protein
MDTSYTISEVINGNKQGYWYRDYHDNPLIRRGWGALADFSQLAGYFPVVNNNALYLWGNPLKKELEK